jgi:hypothetical protein
VEDSVADWSDMSNDEKLDYLLVALSRLEHELKRIEQGVFTVSTELTRRINDLGEQLKKILPKEGPSSHAFARAAISGPFPGPRQAPRSGASASRSMRYFLPPSPPSE